MDRPAVFVENEPTADDLITFIPENEAHLVKLTLKYKAADSSLTTLLHLIMSTLLPLKVVDVDYDPLVIYTTPPEPFPTSSLQVINLVFQRPWLVWNSISRYIQLKGSFQYFLRMRLGNPRILYRLMYESYSQILY